MNDFSELKSIYFAALEHPSPAERSKYLHRACGDNESLRRHVEKMLAAKLDAESFLELPAGPSMAELHELTENYCPIPECPGTLIGPYKLLEQIGEGGFGFVFLAEQTEPVRRKVALKVLKAGMDTRQVVARFEAERQALAIMDHPNIARVFDGGATATGRPYFVMELVRGVPVTEYCDQNHLSPRERLELFVTVCHAVQHAHQKGLIHRDLKPANVLVSRHDTTPTVKIIDFGVAKALGQSLTDKTLFTGIAQMIGTPMYMSPEQAGMSDLDVDTRSDIYSLGVLLYELLTGTTPFDKDRLKSVGFDEMRRIIREDDPPKPSTRISTVRAAGDSTASGKRGSDPRQLSRLLRGELDWIVMKALEKDRSRRYESASALAADIQRYLSDEPVLACPPTAMYRFQKFARKHKPALATAAAIAACLILGTTVSAWQAVRATTAEAQANANEQKAVANEHKANAERDEVKALNERLQATQSELKSTLYVAHINLARHAFEEADIPRVLTLLQQHLPKPGEPDQRGFEWHFLHRMCQFQMLTLQGHTRGVRGIAYSPDGKRLASASSDKTVKVWDAQTGQEILTLTGHTSEVGHVAFSPDGKRLASGSDDAVIKLWDAQTGRELHSIETDGGGYSGLAFSPDGNRLASGDSEGTADKGEWLVKVWDLQTSKDVLRCKGHSEDITGVAFSRDGKRLAAASMDNTVRLWDAHTGAELLVLPDASTGVAFSPDDRLLASASWKGGVVKVWDSQSGQELHNFAHTGASSVAFSPDGQRILAASNEGIVRDWDLRTGREIQTIRGPGETVVVSPDGVHFASADSGQTAVKVWNARKDQEKLAFTTAGGESVAFSPDFSYAASAATDHTVKIWNAQTGEQLRTLKGHTVPIWAVAISSDGKRVASGGGGHRAADGTKYGMDKERAELKVWDAQTGQELLDVKGLTGILNGVAFSPDGNRIASGAAAQTNTSLAVWDVRTGQKLFSLPGSGGFTDVDFSPDGTRLAGADWYNTRTVKVLDAQSGQELLNLNGGGVSVAFSPDGKRLASGSKVWDAETGKELLAIEGGHSAVFSPDGKRLAGVSKAWDALNSRVWDAQTGQLLLSLKNAGQPAAFSPDSHRLATNAPDGSVRIYDATPLPENP